MRNKPQAENLPVVRVCQGEEEMNGVHLSGSTNSTMFTDCCGCAITDRETRCPECGEEVYPGDDSTENERRNLRWDMAYGPMRQKGKR